MHNTLWITVGRIDLLEIVKGKIDIEIEVDPGLNATSSLREYQPYCSDIIAQEDIATHTKLADLSGVGKNAALFERAFISYAHKDHWRVGNFLNALTAAYGSYYVDVLDMEQGPNWIIQAAKAIQNANIVYLFWSDAASNSKSINDELDLIHTEIRRRNREKNSGLQQLMVCLVPLEATSTPPPSWLQQMTPGFSKRTEAFRGCYAAK